MKTYNVKITDTAVIDWESIDKAMIDVYLWSDDYKPEAYAQVVYAATGDEKEGLYAHLVACETNPRAIYHKHNEPVFRDSCLEFFFTMNDAGKPFIGYINIESNSDPTTLIGFGKDRYGRTPIVEMGFEPFSVTGKKTDGRWEIFEFVPADALKKIFGITKIDENTHMAANFYKCGGDHPIQPYGSWAPIDSPTPDFHRPEYFGELKLTK